MEHDFSTDEGLRKAIESCFGEILPDSNKAYEEFDTRTEERDRVWAVTYALGTTSKDALPNVRKSIYLDVTGDRNHGRWSFMFWRMRPRTQDDGGRYAVVLRIGKSWMGKDSPTMKAQGAEMMML